MNHELRDYSHLTDRPEPAERLFTSKAVEDKIEEVAVQIADPELQRMFEQCLPSTLDTMVSYREDEYGNPDTVILTGDIPAMWLRDSTNQVWPYLRLVNEDEKLDKMFRGLISRQAKCVLIDPYANAFKHPHMDNPPTSDMWGEGDGWDERVWERKYELDSLIAHLRLVVGYYRQTGDASIFTDEVMQSIRTVLDVIESEQNEIGFDRGEMYRALRPDGTPMPKFENDGKGYPNKSVGLSRNLYRPSDDEAVLPYLIPANAMAVVALDGLTKILKNLSQAEMAERCENLAEEIDEAIATYGTVQHEKFGKIFAYEVDGDMGYLPMDDPNVPSLLSLVYLGYCRGDNQIWQATKEFIFSDENRYHYRGEYEGLGSPHTPEGFFWPIASIMRALTSDDDEEIIACLRTLKETHAGTHFMHESINVNDPNDYTRPWFGWANSLFGELILDLAERKPHILQHEF